MNITRRTAIISDRATKRRKNKRVLLTALSVFGVGFLIVSLIWFSQASFFIIKKVEVDGVGEVLERNVTFLIESRLEESLLWFLPRRNILLFNKNSVEKEILETYTRIKSVEIKKKSFSRVEVVIEERKPIAIWCDSGIVDIGKCYFVDEFGYIFRKAPYFSDHVYYELYGGPILFEDNKTVISASSSNTPSVDLLTDTNKKDTTYHNFLGVQYIPKETFILTMLFIKAIEQEGIPTYAMVVKDKHLFELSLGEGGILKFSPTQDLAKAVQDFKTAYEKKFKDDSKLTPSDVEYIDIRFNNKVVFKFDE